MISSNPKRLECIKDLIKTARNSRFSALRKLATDDQGRNYTFFALAVKYQRCKKGFRKGSVKLQLDSLVCDDFALNTSCSYSEVF